MNDPLHRYVVPETYVQLLYEYLEARGHAPEAVLGEPWPAPGHGGGGGIDVDLWERMLERAGKRLRDPLIGLHVGQTITARHLGVLGSVLLACENVGAALQRFERYMRLVIDVTPMTRRIGPGWLELACEVSRHRTGPLADETGFAALVQFCRNLVRGPVNPIAVRFIHPSPADTRPYEAYFGCPVSFNQTELALRLDSDALALPLKSPDPALVALLERHADRLLAELPQQDEIVEQVRRAIASALREGEPGIETISAGLGYSPRTLQRRLHQAGSSFRAELNLTRHELAVSYLRDSRLQIVDIALLLGYSEHSAFTRAFREWSGHTPQRERDLAYG